jgi:hypothetical protein
MFLGRRNEKERKRGENIRKLRGNGDIKVP